MRRKRFAVKGLTDLLLQFIHHQASNPSASHKSCKISTICGSGTGCGKKRGAACCVCVNITSMISSTFSEVACRCDDDSEVVLVVLFCVHCSRLLSHSCKPLLRNLSSGSLLLFVVVGEAGDDMLNQSINQSNTTNDDE